MIVRVVPEFEFLDVLGFEFKINGSDRSHFILQKDNKTFKLNMLTNLEHQLEVEDSLEIRNYSTNNMSLEDFIFECFEQESQIK